MKKYMTTTIAIILIAIGLGLLVWNYYSKNNSPFFEETPSMGESRADIDNNAQKFSGTGLLNMNTTETIPLYYSETDEVPFDSITFVEKVYENIDGFTGTQFVTEKTTLEPYNICQGECEAGNNKISSEGVLSLPGAELVFRVLNFSPMGFEVVTNEKENKTAYIKNLENAKYISKYESWDEYLKRLEFITIARGTVYDKPNGKVLYKLKEEENLPFGIDDVDGDWIHLIKGVGREAYFKPNKNYSGWIKWREGDRKLIEIVEATYD